MIFATDESEIKISSENLCFYFYTNWMPFQKRMKSMLEKMEEKYKDTKFIAIDVDFFKTSCKRFKIQSVPEIILYVKCKEVKRLNGLVLSSALNSAFTTRNENEK